MIDRGLYWLPDVGVPADAAAVAAAVAVGRRRLVVVRFARTIPGRNDIFTRGGVGVFFSKRTESHCRCVRRREKGEKKKTSGERKEGERARRR